MQKRLFEMGKLKSSHPNIQSMVQAKKGKTTESNRRHAFSSFRERIDSIKIEPNLKLSKRVHDYVESSHFLTTLEHWKEINISGNFTDFLDKVEVYSQSLPQILHHQKAIFEALQEHIKVNDANSIQPLLELLAQFVHDLGSDFMPYYIKFLNLLIDLAMAITPNDLQNNRNASNILEWTFNCLAFAFKYLSRTLTQDLLPTFEILLPLLKLSKKTYISRFCAEALSFLVRKLKVESLTAILKYSFNEQYETIKENDAYCESLTILYSEAMKSTSGSFHSKSTIILSKIIEISLENVSHGFQVQFISIVSDILLDIIHHGSDEACPKFYKLVTDFLIQIVNENANPQSLIAVSQILAASTFADSGFKIKDWEPILNTLQLLLEKVATLSANKDLLNEVMESLSYFFVILFRNCDINSLTKYHKIIFDSMISLNNGHQFLIFAESSLFINKSKMVNFGIGKYIQEFINRSSENEIELKKLAFFLARLKENNYYDITPEPGITKITQSSLVNQLQKKYSTISTPEDLQEVYWRLFVLRNGHESTITYNYLLKLLDTLLDHKFPFKSHFSHDVVSVVIDSLTQILKTSSDSSAQVSVFRKVISHFADLQESSLLIASVNNFIINCNKSIHEELQNTYEQLFTQITHNLYLPNHDSRLNSIELLITIHNSLSMEVSTLLSQIRIIEQIPLTLNTGRDISLRVRNLAADFKNAERVSEFECTIISHYFIGLLTNKFQPCWLAVHEALPSVIKLISKQFWDLCIKFIKMNYNEQQETYFEYSEVSFDVLESNLIDWQAKNYRLRDNFVNAEEYCFVKYRNITKSIMEYGEKIRADNKYSFIMRSKSIEALSVIPWIAESHSDILVPLVLNQPEEVEDDDEEGEEISLRPLSSWTLKDRNDLVALFGKFKNLKRVHNSKELHEYLLNLLCHKQLQVQKLALDVLLNWGIGAVNKYRDNLKNLLDDTIFRDELSKFLTKDIDSKIEDQDLSQLMPLILRILFGRVQGSPKSNSKLGKRFAVVTVLPNLSDEDITTFLKLGSDRLSYLEFYNSKEVDTSKNQIKRVSGYVNLLSEVYNTLGQKYQEVLSTTIKPLVYSLIVGQRRIEHSDEDEDDINTAKAARNIRQLGMRCLSELFNLLGETFVWDEYIPVIYEFVFKPRMEKFDVENLQQVSSLMKIITSWIDLKNTIKFLYVDNFAPAEAVISLLGHSNAKESVVSTILDFSVIALTKKNVEDEKYFTLLALLVNSLLKNLPSIIDNITSRDVGSKAISVLLLLIQGDYIEDNETKVTLLDSLTKALDKPQSQIDAADKANILLSLAALIDSYDCSFEEILPLYETCSKSFRVYSDRRIRATLVDVFNSIGNRFIEIEQISKVLADLNSFSSKRMQEVDFDRRLDSFKLVNEQSYSTYTPTQWLPLLYCGLYFINDENELALRTNATYLLRRFIDCFSQKDTIEEATPYIRVFKNVVLPHLRIGLRKQNEDVQSEYIALLAHAVTNARHFNDFEDMRALTYKDDDESNFFKNVNHIQLHRRQRAIKRIVEHRSQLSENSISHYILPIIEHYAITPEEKFVNIGHETLETISYLVRCVSWSHFKALFKRYVANLRHSKPESLKSNVAIIVAVSKAFMFSTQAREKNLTEDVIKNMPTDQAEIDTYVTKELFPPLLKVLVVRNDETIVARSPLAEALTCLIMCVSKELIESELPGILTSTCQVMRSRSEELRDAVRKSLSKIAVLLGPEYLKFIIQELKTALSRGSQIHVLSFTVHHLLMSISSSLVHGDLNECLRLIVDVVMEDIFGAAGQEKDAEGYNSKMKEVKFKKSFDTAEILSANINLSHLSTIINPIKLLLRETIALKTQNKLDELMRRYALGINHNDEAGNKDILVTCFEIHQQASEVLKERKAPAPLTQSEEHFLVKLSSKPTKTHVSNMLHVNTLQKFALELLRTAISRHELLLTVSNLSGFIPLFEEGLKSENEGVVISSLKLLNIVVRLPFGEEQDEIFKNCARASLNLIKDSPSTNSELCQSALRFLATAIRHKPEINLKDTAVSYILIRIQPDLEEPNRQGLAFNFLKAVVASHIMLPEVYDTMDKVAKIMVVNHTKEIRDMSRSVFFQFLMEYDQGRGRLEKQFKFLVNNLAYSTESGRQSVMELTHLIIVKSGPELLGKLASSFFVALANVLIADDSGRCREMATSLISSMFKKLGKDNLGGIDKYCIAWLNQSSNHQLKRCGLNIYKIFVSEFGYGENEALDRLAISNIEGVLRSSKNADESETEIEWELLYSTLNVFSTITSKLRENCFNDTYANVWRSTIDCLLFPHAWVRLISSRLIGILLSNLDKLGFELSNYEVQTIAYRLLHQLAAPSISTELGTQIVKNLVLVAMRWEANNTKYEYKLETSDDTENSAKYESANDYLVSRTSAIMRQENNYKNSFTSKATSIKLAAMLVQLTGAERLTGVAEKFLLALYNFTELKANNSKEEEELVNLTSECMQLIEQKLGVTEYTKVYSQVKSAVNARRQERKTKRSQMAVHAPDVAARRKLKKHERSREKRKHEKDDNGYYRSKKNRFN